MESEVLRKYGDIIHMDRPVSPGHLPMSMESRAAQFAPFAALTGYDAVIRESGRLTDSDSDIDEYEKVSVDRALRYLADTGEEAVFCCFIQDDRKAGGSWVSCTGRIRRVDPVMGVLLLQDGTQLKLDVIRRIELPDGRNEW